MCHHPRTYNLFLLVLATHNIIAASVLFYFFTYDFIELNTFSLCSLMLSLRRITDSLTRLSHTAFHSIHHCQRILVFPTHCSPIDYFFRFIDVINSSTLCCRIEHDSKSTFFMSFFWNLKKKIKTFQKH